MSVQKEITKSLNINSFQKMKESNDKITCLTAYDYTSAKMVDNAGVDLILVGDSLGMVINGYDSTIPVTLDEVIYDTKSVKRAVERAFVVAEMPFGTYKVNIDDAQEKLSMHLDEYWREKELDFKRALILQITNTDALSDSQREEIADMIQNYDVNNFKEQADSVFVRKRFLKGNLLGIRISDDEKLDIKRLARSYNDRIKRIVNDMSQSMNEDCFSQFKIWEEKLLAKINANLTELNPELKSLAEIIRIETENITELENNQTMIQASLDTIKDLMSWKEAEEE